MGRLALPRDQVPLDAEGAEDDPEREVHGLEHRALLDVELEVGDRAVELAARVERAVEVDAVRARSRRGARARRRPGADAARPGRPSSRRRRSSRTGCGRSARPPRRPSPRAGRSPAVAPPPRSRRRTSTPAITFRQPSSQPPFGTESMWPPISSERSDSPRSVNHWLPASSRSYSSAEPVELLAEPRARRRPRVASRRRAARRSRRRSAPGARAARRRCASAGAASRGSYEPRGRVASSVWRVQIRGQTPDFGVTRERTPRRVAGV